MRLHTPYTFEDYARRSRNYLEGLVDAARQPYFNVFWTDPPEAAHDWPDFGDVTSRQLQGAIMLRRMSGSPVATEENWLSRVLALIDPADGLLHRPNTRYSQSVADWGDAGLTLYALATAALDRQDDRLADVVHKMAEGMLKVLQAEQYPENWLGSFAVKSLMVVGRALDSQPALEAARLLVERTLKIGRLFTPDNTFGVWGHMHGNLRSMVGMADYALTIGDPVLYSRMDALYRYVKTTGTRFGFLPEAVGRQGDIIACETCALMDFAGMGITLANHGHPEYWGDMERLARNHLVESQVRAANWLGSETDRPDTEQFTWRDIAGRVEGAWAGWSSPNHILACRETLNAHWGGAELRDKTRALQNCCGGSGVHALFILWKNAARFEGDTLHVNMHLDKKLPQGEIRCQQPFVGLTSISLDQDCSVLLRIPEFTQPSEMKFTLNGSELANAARPDEFKPAQQSLEAEREPVRAWGNFLELGHFHAGDRIEASYPLPIETEEISIGNPGFRQWHYRVTWKGDTVMRMQPLENEIRTAYSEFEKGEVEVFYGSEGPGPLYQRQGWLEPGLVTEPALHLDDGGLDWWKINR